MSVLDETFEWKGRKRKKYKLGEDDEVIVSPEWIEYKEELRLKYSAKQFGLDLDSMEFGFDTYTGADVDSNIPKLLKYCEEFATTFHRVHLYLWSRANSTQKSTMAKAVLLEVVKQGFSAKFVLMADLLKTLTDETFSEASAKKVKEFLEVDFLVVDDSFDPRKATLFKSGYQLSFLDNFLRSRLEVNKKATCFTSNVPIEEIGSTWTTSIGALVARSVHSPMHFQDPLKDFNITDIWS